MLKAGQELNLLEEGRLGLLQAVNVGPVLAARAREFERRSRQRLDSSYTPADSI